MDLDRFIAILANRLTGIVPDGFHVTAEHGMLWYSAEQEVPSEQQGDRKIGRSGTYARSNYGRYGESDEENIVGVSTQALDELQDFISEATHLPWPGVTSQPAPHSEIVDSYLHLWYGDADSPAVACERIPLTGFL